MATKYTGQMFEFSESQQSDLLAKFLSTATKYTGQLFEFSDPTETYPITHAVVTKKRIAVDWFEDGGLTAKSDDGEIYAGTFGYRDQPLEPDDHCEFRLYRVANGDVLLFGRWWRADGSESGCWVFRLSPLQVE